MVNFSFLPPKKGGLVSFFGFWQKNQAYFTSPYHKEFREVFFKKKQ